MNAFATIISDAIVVLMATILTSITLILKGRPPRRVRRWARKVGRVAEVAVGVAGIYLVICGLILAAGIKHNNPVTMYVGFTLVAVFTMFTKALVSLCENLVKTIWFRLGWLITFGHINPTIDPSVHETLTDIGMCMIMCSVFALDGQDIGLTLNAIGWTSLASLVALIIMSGAKITIRRKVMGGFAALFVLTYMLFQLMPASREFAQATAEHLQVGERRAAEVIRPAMPLAEVRLHQESEQNVLQSELSRYTQKVTNFERAAANHTPTSEEVAEYQKAMENVTTLRQALKLHNPESSTWASYSWLAFYTLLTLAVFAVAIKIVLMIVKAMPKGGVQAPGGTGVTGSANTNPAPANQPAATGHSHGGFNIKPWLIGFAVVIALVLLGVMAFGKPSFNSGMPLSVQSASAVNAVVPIATLSLTASAAEKTYQEISVSADGGEFQLDGRVLWQKLGEQSGLLKVVDGETFTWDATGTVCESEAVGYYCSGPNGITALASPWAKSSLVRPAEYPVGDAYYNELLLKVGSVQKRAGAKGSYTVPAGTGEQYIEMMANVRVPDLPKTREGFYVKVQK